MKLNDLSLLLLHTINERAITGYDLTKHFNEKNIREVSHQQVYRNLDLLEVNGLLVSVEKEQQGKPNRIVYSLTSKGKRIYEVFIADEATKQAANIQPIRSFAAVMLQLGNMRYFEGRVTALSEEIENIEAQLNDTECAIERLHLREKLLIRESERTFALEVLESKLAS